MDFEFFQGDTKRIHFSLKKSDGSPLELVGTTLRWQVSRLKPNKQFSSTPILSKDENSGIEIDDELNGAVTVVIEPAETVALSGDFYMELEATDSTGDVATVYTGSFRINKALIKPQV